VARSYASIGHIGRLVFDLHQAAGNPVGIFSTERALTLNVADVLSSCRLFGEVPPESFQRLAVMARICRFQRQQVIFRDGEPCPGTYIVGEGLVRVYKVAPNGKEHVLHMVEPGGTFAEVAAMGGFANPANAEAVQPSTCVLLPLDEFQLAMQQDHQLCLGMIAGLTLWVKHLVGLMGDVVLRDATGRVARYLLELKPDDTDTVQLPALKRHVANHLNLTSETFSRTLRRLVEAGLLADDNATHIRLLDREKLQLASKGFFPEA